MPILNIKGEIVPRHKVQKSTKEQKSLKLRKHIKTNMVNKRVKLNKPYMSEELADKIVDKIIARKLLNIFKED